MSKRIYLSSPTMCGRESEYVNETFESNWIAPLGPNVDAFETEICRYLGAQYAVAMTTGTAAIQMALRYLNPRHSARQADSQEEQDIVFCSSLTFAASCNPIIYQNATPVFIDSEPETWNMSSVALERAFEKYPNPKAVIIVDLYGQAADMDEILGICEHYKVPVIEDAAEALGATYKGSSNLGKKCGTFGDFGVLSFNGNKIITTSGGGMLICPDEETRDKILKWITQSRDSAPHYEHSELGFNYRMSNVLAAIGRGQLTVLDERVRQKKRIFETYKEAFSDIAAIEMMPLSNKGEPNYWLSCMTIKPERSTKPLDIIAALEDENIESRPIWKPMHLQPYYKGYDYFTHGVNSSHCGRGSDRRCFDPQSPDVSANIFSRGLCLPSDVKMTEVDLERVIDIIKGCF